MHNVLRHHIHTRAPYICIAYHLGEDSQNVSHRDAIIAAGGALHANYLLIPGWEKYGPRARYGPHIRSLHRNGTCYSVMDEVVVRTQILPTHLWTYFGNETCFSPLI